LIGKVEYFGKCGEIVNSVDGGYKSLKCACQFVSDRRG
jgi:hypothetical protein